MWIETAMAVTAVASKPDGRVCCFPHANTTYSTKLSKKTDGHANAMSDFETTIFKIDAQFQFTKSPTS